MRACVRRSVREPTHPHKHACRGARGDTHRIIEDGDGTEVTITENKEVKFVEGNGIDMKGIFALVNSAKIDEPDLVIARSIFEK